MKNGGIVATARMGSSRFPGKTLMPFLDRPLLAWPVTRLRSLSSPFVIATTTNPIDDVIVEFAASLGVPVFRGSEFDVLERLYLLLQTHQWDWLIRVSGDSPFIDPCVIENAIKQFEIFVQTTEQIPDILTNLFPYRSYAPGFSVELITSTAMDKLIKMAPVQDTHYREHVTTYAYAHPKFFALCSIEPPPMHFDPATSFCIDTKADLEKLEKLANRVENPLHAPYSIWLEAYQNCCI